MSARDILQAAAGIGTGGGSGGWDLANAVLISKPELFNVVSQETDPSGLFFKPDGLSMYVTGSTGDSVNQYTLSTAWDVSTASYLQNFSVGAQEASPQGLFFKPDGLSMYVIGSSGDDVNQYTLTTAWDVSTASYVQNFSIAAQETGPTDVFFTPDGLSMYVIGTIGDDVNQYTLTTAWDISTASYLQNFSIAAQETVANGLFISPDGLHMYVIGSTGDDVNQYTLTTAWDVSTASYLQNFSVAAQGGAPDSIFFKSDGKKMYVLGSLSNRVYQYTLSTAWDVTTAVYSPQFFAYVGTQETSPQSVFFSPDGLHMYVIGTIGDDVNQYTLTTAWDVSTASYLQRFSVSAQDSAPRGLFFKPDGLSMYVTGSTGDSVNQYTLSTAWDVSTASYLQNFSVATQDGLPQSVFFKPDGLSMYVAGSSGDSVYQYTLSAAWDVSTASYVQTFSVASQDKDPSGLFFKPDGLSMYVIGTIGDSVYQYTLSTAWDVSTASYLQNFSVGAQATSPGDVFFTTDGTMMFITGVDSDSVWTYSL